MARILFDDGNVNLLFKEQEIADFMELWEGGISLLNIARKLRRKPVEIALLIIDLELSKEITPRDSGIYGL